MQCAYNTVNQWLMQLPSKSINRHALNPQGSCHLLAENGHTIAITAQKSCNYFYLDVELFRLPAENRERLFEKALALNFDQLTTKGFTIAIDKFNKTLVASKLLTLSEIDSSVHFTNLIQNLLETAKDITLKLHNQKNNLRKG